MTTHEAQAHINFNHGEPNQAPAYWTFQRCGSRKPELVTVPVLLLAYREQFGRPEVQVEPVNGSGKVWISIKSVKLDKTA
jgi:hypothetical protein